MFLVVPMALLNPMGRPAFLGYYLGLAALWCGVACVGAQSAGRQ
jgi:hypothetical protein